MDEDELRYKAAKLLFALILTVDPDFELWLSNQHRPIHKALRLCVEDPQFLPDWFRLNFFFHDKFDGVASKLVDQIIYQGERFYFTWSMIDWPGGAEVRIDPRKIDSYEVFGQLGVSPEEATKWGELFIEKYKLVMDRLNSQQRVSDTG